MKDLNSVTVSGRLGAEPELRATSSGSSVVNFRMAISRPWRRKGDDDWQEETTWLSVTAWESLAERINDTFGKGDRVVVTGRLKEESWDDKNGGGKRSKLTVVADNVQPMGSWKRDGEAKPRQSADTPDEGFDDDDLPF
jgi:single-strand DNA-binding protein